MKALRSLTLVCALLSSAQSVRANPLPEPSPVGLAMSSENVTMTVSLVESEIHGRFTFSTEMGFDDSSRTTSTIKVPVLVPVHTNGSEIILATKWKVGFVQAEALRRTLFEIARPKIVVNGHVLPDKALGARLILPKDRRSGLERLFKGEDNNYSCAAIDKRYAVVEFTFKAPMNLNRKLSCQIGYRQFHAAALPVPEARYVPFLPVQTNSAASPAFQINLVGSPGVVLDLVSHNTVRSRAASRISIAPRDREAIVVRPSSATTLPPR